ncbi:hypothetical protein [Lacticaseibacillus jixiensis]|uniref:hypothetical protein n=1 Tax=Lacticaseibacillus jixiensis TaxID=3231926 RepID=UPI0036F3EC23
MRHRWVIIICYVVLMLIGLGLLYLGDAHFPVFWVIYDVFGLSAVISGQRVQRNNRRLLAKMWALADELGYTAADLKRLSGKYGELDWAATRPERLTFFPGVKLIKQLTCQMQDELRLRDCNGGCAET